MTMGIHFAIIIFLCTHYLAIQDFFNFIKVIIFSNDRILAMFFGIRTTYLGMVCYDGRRIGFKCFKIVANLSIQRVAMTTYLRQMIIKTSIY
jgi:hypothetical protein